MNNRILMPTESVKTDIKGTQTALPWFPMNAEYIDTYNDSVMKYLRDTLASQSLQSLQVEVLRAEDARSVDVPLRVEEVHIAVQAAFADLVAAVPGVPDKHIMCLVTLSFRRFRRLCHAEYGIPSEFLTPSPPERVTP